MTGMLSCVTKEEFTKFALRIMESSVQMMSKRPIVARKSANTHVFIIDMEGFTLKVKMEKLIISIDNLLKDASYGPTIQVLQDLLSLRQGFFFPGKKGPTNSCLL